MRTLFAVAASAAFGTVVGFGLAVRMLSPSSPSEKIQTKQLILLDEQGRPAAQLVASDGNSVLRFYSNDSKPALEIGVDNAHPYRYLRMYGPKGGLVSALNSNTRAQGASTLYLGDEITTTRVIAGSLDNTDIPPVGERTIEEWGLWVRMPGANLFRVLMKTPKYPSASTVSINLRRADGTTWSVQ